MHPSWLGRVSVYRFEGRTAGTVTGALGTEGLCTPQLCLSVLLPGADLGLPVQPSHIQDCGFRSSSGRASARALPSRLRQGIF